MRNSSNRRPAFLAAAAVVALGIVAACGGGSTSEAPAPSSTASLPTPTGPTVDVEMQDYAFVAPDVQVQVGTAVRWTNRGQAPHTATADDASFDTGQLATGASATHTFATVGTYAYVCTLHPDMTGSVTVVEADTPPTEAPSAGPSAGPTAAPSEEPSAAPSEATRFDVPLTIATAHTVTATVIDWTGLVAAATSGTPGDGASVPVDAVQVANDGPTTLVVTWAGGPCDQEVTVVFDASQTLVTVIQEPCEGDAIAFDRIVRLELTEPIDASTVAGVLQPGGDTPG